MPLWDVICGASADHIPFHDVPCDTSFTAVPFSGTVVKPLHRPLDFAALDGSDGQFQGKRGRVRAADHSAFLEFGSLFKSAADAGSGIASSASSAGSKLAKGGASVAKGAVDKGAKVVGADDGMRCCCNNKGYLVPRKALPSNLAHAPAGEVCKLGGWQRSLYPSEDHRFKQNVSNLPFHHYRRGHGIFVSEDAENNQIPDADKKTLPPAGCSCKMEDAVNFSALKKQYQQDLNRQIEDRFKIKVGADQINIKEFLYSEDPTDTKEKFVCCCANQACRPSKTCSARGADQHFQPDDWVKSGLAAKSTAKESALACDPKAVRARRFERCLEEGLQASPAEPYPDAFRRCTEEAPTYEESIRSEDSQVAIGAKAQTSDPWAEAKAGVSPAAGGADTDLSTGGKVETAPAVASEAETPPADAGRPEVAPVEKPP